MRSSTPAHAPRRLARGASAGPSACVQHSTRSPPTSPSALSALCPPIPLWLLLVAALRARERPTRYGKLSRPCLARPFAASLAPSGLVGSVRSAGWLARCGLRHAQGRGSDGVRRHVGVLIGRRCLCLPYRIPYRIPLPLRLAGFSPSSPWGRVARPGRRCHACWRRACCAIGTRRRLWRAVRRFVESAVEA